MRIFLQKNHASWREFKSRNAIFMYLKDRGIHLASYRGRRILPLCLDKKRICTSSSIHLISEFPTTYLLPYIANIQQIDIVPPKIAADIQNTVDKIVKISIMIPHLFSLIYLI